MNNNEIELLKSLKPCTKALLETLTDVKCTKTFMKENGFESVQKETARYVCLNHSYKKQVNDKLEQKGLEPTFESKGLPWGEWVIDNVLIKHKDAYYLRYTDDDESDFHESIWYINGKQMPEDSKEVMLVKLHLNARRHDSKAQAVAGLTDRKDQVKVNNVKWDNITDLVTVNDDYEEVERIV